MRDLIDTVLERAGRDPEYLRELLTEFTRVVEALEDEVRELKLDNAWLLKYYNQGGTPRHPERPPTWHQSH
jgi:hypothetical protein